MHPHGDLLRKTLLLSESLTSLTTTDWDLLIPQARRAALLARLESLLSERGLLDRVPKPVRTHLKSARIVAANEDRVMRWEINRIQRALAGIDTPIVLLKGAAYALAGLPLAKGRISSDVDILVLKEKLQAVEEKLLQHGWRHVKLQQYDQSFYRTWSHELPPLQHRDRKTIVDVHHTILPLTGRLHPDPRKLLEAAVPLAGTKFSVLAPVDMVLHSAAHAFQDGDFQRALRDLVDLDDLLRHFGARRSFWNELLSRAEQLELTRPLFYAMRYAHGFFNTPVPGFVSAQCHRWRPAWPALIIMDQLVSHAVNPIEPAGKSRRAKFSLWLLYVRSHWLRMPPWLLAKHLLRKTFRRWGSAENQSPAELPLEAPKKSR